MNVRTTAQRRNTSGSPLGERIAKGSPLLGFSTSPHTAPTSLAGLFLQHKRAGSFSHSTLTMYH